jgi:hypothetical protein
LNTKKARRSGPLKVAGGLDHLKPRPPLVGEGVREVARNLHEGLKAGLVIGLGLGDRHGLRPLAREGVILLGPLTEGEGAEGGLTNPTPLGEGRTEVEGLGGGEAEEEGGGEDFFHVFGILWVAWVQIGQWECSNA